MSLPLTAKEEENNDEHVTLNNVKEDPNKLIQDVTIYVETNSGSRKEALSNSNTIFHILSAKVCVMYSKSGLTIQRPDLLGILLCLRPN